MPEKIKCPECGADLEEKEVIIKLLYRGNKEDILRQIYNITGVYAWQESQ